MKEITEPKHKFIYAIEFTPKEAVRVKNFFNTPGGDLVGWLHHWGQFLMFSADPFRSLAGEIEEHLYIDKGEPITTKCHGDYLEFDGPEHFLDKMVKKNLLFRARILDI